MNEIYKHNISRSWINTNSGKKFFPLDPKIEDFDINDQAHSISNQARYLGHPDLYFSVAAHALLVSEECERRAKDAGLSPELVQLAAQWGLIHDNGEAYYGDIVYPLKQMEEFDFLRALEERYDHLLCQWLGIDSDGVAFNKVRPIIDHFDKEATAYESPIIFLNVHKDWKFFDKSSRYGKEINERITALTFYCREYTKQSYLSRFAQLFGGVK